MFAGGTDTTYTVLEWAMAELLIHPEVMKQVQNEVRHIGNVKSNITEDDLDKMHYLKVVIKETPIISTCSIASISTIKPRCSNQGL